MCRWTITKLANSTMRLSHFLECTTLEHKCAHLCSNVVYCEIWYRYILEFAHFCFNVLYCRISNMCGICEYIIVSLPARANYDNLAKDKPAWGLGLTQEDKLKLTDGIDNPSVLIKENGGAGWAFLAVDLETSIDIGYIRVILSLCK